MLLTQAKKVAEQNGLNFADVIAEVEGSRVKSSPTVPRPPSPAAP